MGKKQKQNTKSKQESSILKRLVKVDEYIQTGCTQLDMAISCNKDKYGGIPTRRIIEFSGTGASGKTYICGEIVGNAMRKHYDVYVDDIEKRWDLQRLKTFGFKFGDKRFNYLNPSKSVEECFEKMFRILDKQKSGQKILYVIDPIAALYALQELKSDKMSQARAKALQKYFRFLKDRVAYDAHTTNCILFSNQLIDDPAASKFGPKKKTPGGNALIHWPSVRVRFSFRGKWTKEEKGRKDKLKKVIGVKLHADVVKNSEDDAFREADFRILNRYGIDDIYSCAAWLKVHTDVLGDGDSWYKMPPNKKKGKKYKAQNGLPAFVRYVEDKGLERRLQFLCRKYYRKWHEPEKRKPRYR